MILPILTWFFPLSSTIRLPFQVLRRLTPGTRRSTDASPPTHRGRPANRVLAADQVFEHAEVVLLRQTGSTMAGEHTGPNSKNYTKNGTPQTATGIRTTASSNANDTCDAAKSSSSFSFFEKTIEL